MSAFTQRHPPKSYLA